MRTIAIDPGANGALVFHENGKIVIHLSNKVSAVDAIRDAIAGAERPVCYLEQVGGYIGRPQPGSAMFKFGANFGFWLGLLAAYDVRHVLVRPQTWQKNLIGVSSKGPERKRLLRDEARRRFPQVAVTLDNCDALLLLDWAIRQNGGVL
jgi:hypothetical protein